LNDHKEPSSPKGSAGEKWGYHGRVARDTVKRTRLKVRIVRIDVALRESDFFVEGRPEAVVDSAIVVGRGHREEVVDVIHDVLDVISQINGPPSFDV
jgi:hypothetical protein